MNTDNNLDAAWRKASYSNHQGSCIEVGGTSGVILVRDTTLNSRGPVLRVTPADWDRITESVKLQQLPRLARGFHLIRDWI